MERKLKLENTKRVYEYWRGNFARIFIEIYDDSPSECVLTHLWVDEGLRNKGYGKQILSEAELIAKEKGCTIAFLKVEHNSWMHVWYLRCGYTSYRCKDEDGIWLFKAL